MISVGSVQNRAAAACETACILESVVARLLTSYYENTHRKVNAMDDSRQHLCKHYNNYNTDV